MPDNYFARYLPLLMHFVCRRFGSRQSLLLSYIHRLPTAYAGQDFRRMNAAWPRSAMPAALLGEVLPGRHALYSVRRGSRLPISLGGDPARLKMFGFWEMLVYIGIVLVGFFYIWKKGALDWGAPSVRRAKFNGPGSRHHRPRPLKDHPAVREAAPWKADRG